MLIKSFCRSIPIRYYFSKRKIDYTKDYYKILQVAEDADATAIKQRYYALAKQFHPDRQKGTDEQFRAYSEAYEILGEEQLRRQYDRSRSKSEDDENKKQQQQHYNLNYEPYSKTSRTKWALYRKGWRKDQITNHYNYEQNIILGEMGESARKAEIQHWNLPLQLITPKQIQAEKERMEVIDRKYEEDARDYLIRKDKLLDQKVEQIRQKLDNHFIGKRIRFIYDFLVEKSEEQKKWSLFLKEAERVRDEEKKNASNRNSNQPSH